MRVQKARSRGKTKPSRGLDLEEVRRRTSLLSGEARTFPPPLRAPPTSRSAAPRSADSSSYYDVEWQRQQAPAASSSADVLHPLHAARADPLFSGGGLGGTFDDRGNYFNEDMLLARAQGSKAKGLAPVKARSRNGKNGQGAWEGDARTDSAGNFFNTARSVKLIVSTGAMVPRTKRVRFFIIKTLLRHSYCFCWRAYVAPGRQASFFVLGEYVLALR